MKFLYSLGGGNIPVIREFDIKANTKFKKGQIVIISTDAEIAPNAVGGCIGVAAEEHTGEKDILNERNNGTKLRVDITRDAVYEVKAPKITATKGTATTLVCSADGITTNLANSRIVLVHKGENSNNTDSAGTVRNVQSVVVSGTEATFTIDNGGIVSEGDVYALIPKYGFVGNVDRRNGDFCCASSGSTVSAYVVNSNTETLTLEVMIKKDFIN